jgi:hypothetical protein
MSTCLRTVRAAHSRAPHMRTARLCMQSGRCFSHHYLDRSYDRAFAGTRVDYASLRVSPAFADFCDVAGELAVLPAATLDGSTPLNERKAFWVNLCEALQGTPKVFCYVAPADPSLSTRACR